MRSAVFVNASPSPRRTRRSRRPPTRATPARGRRGRSTAPGKPRARTRSRWRCHAPPSLSARPCCSRSQRIVLRRERIRLGERAVGRHAGDVAGPVGVAGGVEQERRQVVAALRRDQIGDGDAAVPARGPIHLAQQIGAVGGDRPVDERDRSGVVGAGRSAATRHENHPSASTVRPPAASAGGAARRGRRGGGTTCNRAACLPDRDRRTASSRSSRSRCAR